jgi:hypothetical protein
MDSQAYWPHQVSTYSFQTHRQARIQHSIFACDVTSQMYQTFLFQLQDK